MQKTAENRSTALIKRPTSFAEWVSDISKEESYGRGLSVKGFVFELLIILSLAAVTYAALAFNWNKFSRAEVFFAECAREMLVSGNFITPLYHNQPFFDKPIFVYWLIIGMFKTFGVSHFAARVPSIVASLVTIGCTAFAGARLFGRRSGLLAGAILTSAFMYLSFSYLCMSDMFLVMFDTVSLIFIYAGMRFLQQRTTFWRIAAISTGLSFLTKGPVGVVLPVAASLVYMALTKRLSFIKAGHVLWAAIALIVIASPWFYAAYFANGTSALIHFFVQENLQRFAGSTYDGHKPFWYTICSFFLGFAPWSILLPPAFIWFCKNLSKPNNRVPGQIKVTDDLNYEPMSVKIAPRLSLTSMSLLSVELSAELFLWIWVFISVGFFCFSRGKCDYYTLPAYPAAAILLAEYICNCLPKFQNIIKGLALAISAGTIVFACVALPQMMCLVPINKYAFLIKNCSIDTAKKKISLGVDNSLFSWIDEILFQSGIDAHCLTSTREIDNFIAQNEPAVIMVPEDKYNALSTKQKKQWRVLSCDRVATHSLTPGYVLSRGGNILDPMPLIVATNTPEKK